MTTNSHFILKLWPWDAGDVPLLVTDKGTWYIDKLLDHECSRDSVPKWPKLKAKACIFKFHDSDEYERALLGFRGSEETEVLYVTKGMGEMSTRITALRSSLMYTEHEEDDEIWGKFVKSSYTLWEDFKKAKRGYVKTRKFGI